MKLMKTVLASAVAAVGLIAGGAQAADMTIKFSHVVAENTPKGKMARKFEELAEAAVPGLDVQVFPNSQLYDDSRVLEAMLLGDVQIAAPSLSKFQRFTNKLQVFDLPFLFDDMAAVDRFQQSEAGQSLLSSMQDKGLIGLGYLHNGMKQFSANEPILTPEDAAGKKFRIQTSDILAAQFEAVDAIPVKKPFSEVFTLLQTKAIDGAENPWSNLYSKKFFEVQDYVTESNHGVLDYLVVTSSSFWNGLEPDVRDKLNKAMNEAIAYGNEQSADLAARDRQAIIDDEGTKVVQMSAEQRQAWVEAEKPVWSEFEDDIGRDLIDAALKANQ